MASLGLPELRLVCCVCLLLVDDILVIVYY